MIKDTTKSLTKLMRGVCFFLAASCSNDDDAGDVGNCDLTATCFACVNCQGHYGHMLNGEYCVDGFDNCEDWEAMKAFRESEDGCDCQYIE
jgi:hypothetical protein